ncbi:hypothetical protein B0H13DRAFT_940267 [Mycena leptocephala]|nr:hypothetical protein B0H13DRAFT_940267 [Mycena leptocephala]
MADCLECGKAHPTRTVPGQSPFHALIAGDVLPSASQVDAVRDFVHDIDAEVARRELDILAARASLDRLLCETDQLRSCSQQHKAFIAPIRRIPPELIAEIFMHSIALEAQAFRISDSDSDSYYGSERIGGGENYYIVTPRVHKPPLIFGEICHEWRVIALSTPRLWNSITLKCTRSLMQTNLILCETWVKRAGNLPLSFRLHRPAGFKSAKLKLCNKLIQSIVGYAHRWRWLDLDGFPASVYQILEDLLPGSTPELEYLSVIHTPEPTEVGSLNSWRAFRSAPKLHDLYFDYIGAVGVDTERPTFPWSQLTRIDVGDCSPRDCLQILAQALAATFCIFHLTFDVPSLQTPFIHPQLETLKIDSNVAMQAFWSTITCSALSTLSIELHGLGGMGNQDLPQFIARCGGAIEDCTLHQSGITDTEFIACLRQMPRLRHLSVSDYGRDTFTNTVGRALTLASPTAMEDSPPPLVPQLESLSLAGGRLCSDKCLTRMLVSRVRQDDLQPRPMKKLFLYICRKMSDKTHTRIRGFRKSGVEVDVELDYDSEDSSNNLSDGSEDSDSENASDDDDSPHTAGLTQ